MSGSITKGLVYDMPFEEYLAADGVSASQLKAINRSPREARVNVQRETDAMQFGTLLHAMLFENKHLYTIRPDTYGPEGKKWNGNANECKAWMQAHAGETVISSDTVIELTKAERAITGHPHFADLQLGKPEVSMFAFDYGQSGIQLKGRCDSLKVDGDDGIAHVTDLKTTTDASTRGFSREILTRRYHVQAAMYRRILKHLGYERMTWTFIILEKGDVPLVNIRRLEPQAIDFGEQQLERDLELFKKCRSFNWWPDFPDQEEKVGYIDLPEFVYGDTETLSGMTPATN